MVDFRESWQAHGVVVQGALQCKVFDQNSESVAVGIGVTNSADSKLLGKTHC